MQDFSPFTPELLGAFRPPAVRTTSQASWARPLCGLDWANKQFVEQPKFHFLAHKLTFLNLLFNKDNFDFWFDS
jgi:hypothetical protein